MKEDLAKPGCGCHICSLARRISAMKEHLAKPGCGCHICLQLGRLSVYAQQKEDAKVAAERPRARE